MTATVRMELNVETDHIVMRLYSDDSADSIVATIRDTENGMDVRTVAMDTQGGEHLLTDKTDRGTPPLNIVLNMANSLFGSWITSVQAALNRQRLNRLVREAKPITVRSMCMDGKHMTAEFDEMPFQGGIVGIPTYTPDEVGHEDVATEALDIPDELLRSIWGDDEDDADDPREGVEA